MIVVPRPAPTSVSTVTVDATAYRALIAACDRLAATSACPAYLRTALAAIHATT